MYLYEQLRWSLPTKLPPTFQKLLEPVYSSLGEQADKNYVGKDRENQLCLIFPQSVEINSTC